MQYMNEMSKIKERVLPYLKGAGIDIGCYDCKVMPKAIGIDGRKADGVDFVLDNLYDLPTVLSSNVFGKVQYVFSSHVLEHLHDSYRAICEWSSFIRTGGYLILYLPDATRYNHMENLEHLQYTEYNSFIFWFKRVFCGEGKNFKGEQYMPPIFELVESGEDPHEEDLYSFYIVAQKL